MLAELYQYGIRPEGLKEALEQAKSSLLKEKLKDLLVVYEAFQREISSRYITAEEILDVLCRVVPDSQWIKNSVVTLDGYTGFTPVQYRLVELLMVHARKVIVTVTVDPAAEPYKRARIQNLFYMSKDMVCRLEKLAGSRGIARDPDVKLGMGGQSGNVHPGRFGASPSIAFVEKHLYRYSPASYKEEPGEIELFQAPTPAGEIEQVASRIHKLVQNEHVRYREIAVITGDLPGYGYEIVNRFQAEGIPYFMDSKKSILENVMVEFIRASLEVAEKDFSYESVFRLLKTGLVSREQENKR